MDAATFESIELLGSYQAIFNTPDGQRVLNSLVLNTMGRSSFVPGDPYTTAFNEGRRAVVLSILSLLKRDISEVLNAAQEARRMR